MHQRTALMTAACITSFGPPEHIRITRLPVPDTGPGEVLVRVSAVEVNHVDTYIRSGAYRTAITFPFIVGRDLVGSVILPGDSGFRSGARVWCNSLGHDGRQGSFAEYVAVPAERLYPLPDGVDPVSAVSVLHTAATAHIGLFREARISPGETIVVEGVGGGVGSAVAQLAAAARARVIAVDRAENAAWARACGAAGLIDRDDPDLVRRLAEMAPFGVDVYWGQDDYDFDAVVPLMAPGGRIIVTAGLATRAALPIGALYTRDISIHGFAISNATARDLACAAETINRELASGRLRGRIWATLRLADAAQAHRMQEKRAEHDPPGRIVLLP